MFPPEVENVLFLNLKIYNYTCILSNKILPKRFLRIGQVNCSKLTMSR